jgi:hypothetical protein
MSVNLNHAAILESHPKSRFRCFRRQSRAPHRRGGARTVVEQSGPILCITSSSYPLSRRATRKTDRHLALLSFSPCGRAARTGCLRREWDYLEELTSRWSLRIDAPYDNANVTCSWVAAVLRADGTPAVLKIGMPHMEGADGIHALPTRIHASF